jgi:hypothetical protein
MHNDDFDLLTTNWAVENNLIVWSQSHEACLLDNHRFSLLYQSAEILLLSIERRLYEH